MDIQDVLRDIRLYASRCPEPYVRWADAIEAAMREPVAEVVGFDYYFGARAYMSVRSVKGKGYEKFPPGTKLYALPPDAAGEIQPDWDKLEACQQSLREHMAEIERLRKALFDIANRGMAVQREEHRIARAALAGKGSVVNQPLTTGETSDGYHTFNELYEHRHALFLNIMSGIGYDPWISKLHHDGSGFDGWFIAGIDLPTGTISYHLPERLWDAAVFTGAALMERAPEWDGHTSADVVRRLYQMVAPHKDMSEGQDD